jgi:hypothetical protein
VLGGERVGRRSGDPNRLVEPLRPGQLEAEAGPERQQPRVPGPGQRARRPACAASSSSGTTAARCSVTADSCSSSFTSVTRSSTQAFALDNRRESHLLAELRQLGQARMQQRRQGCPVVGVILLTHDLVGGQQMTQDRPNRLNLPWHEETVRYRQVESLRAGEDVVRVEE